MFRSAFARLNVKNAEEEKNEDNEARVVTKLRLKGTKSLQLLKKSSQPKSIKPFNMIFIKKSQKNLDDFRSPKEFLL